MSVREGLDVKRVVGTLRVEARFGPDGFEVESIEYERVD